MTYRLIAEESSLAEASSRIRNCPRIALDCEAAGFHRYTDTLCLVQLTTPDETYLFDPFRLDLADTLRPILEDPTLQVVMHGADFDLRLLDRDLDIQVQGLFDTQVAATLLGADGIGLAALLEDYLGVELTKAHQRADWARRPLPAEFLDYAADDTRYLLPLADQLQEDLREMGREGWAQEEFKAVEAVRFEEDTSDPVTRFKGAHRWGPREVEALRVALAWRDGIAREKDRAPFRVASDAVLEKIILDRPNSVSELAKMRGMSRGLARARGKELLDGLSGVDALPEAELTAYPRGSQDAPGRMTPEERTRADAIRSLRTARADELGLDRGVLLSNAQIGEIVRAAPSTTERLRRLSGIRGWQTELLGSEIVAILKDGSSDPGG